MPDNFLYILINISFYKWGGFIINWFLKKKFSLKNKKFINFINFINNLKAFFYINAKTIILL